jgi:hypothetical protein
MISECRICGYSIRSESVTSFFCTELLRTELLTRKNWFGLPVHHVLSLLFCCFSFFVDCLQKNKKELKQHHAAIVVFGKTSQKP